MWRQCIPEPNTGCWLWLGSVDRDGYGHFKFGGEPGKAHRFAWEFTHGVRPTGMMVCHRCDTPGCINPQHLFLGTSADNVADRHAKSRDARGARHGRAASPERTARGERVNTAVLTAEDVVVMRAAYDAGTSRAVLAKRFGITWTATDRVVRRITWAHIS